MKNSFFSVRITETSASLFSSAYQIFNQESFNFKTLYQATDFINQRYEGRKRQKIYIDGEHGEAVHTGWVYKYRNADYSHSPVEQWNQCDWVEIIKVEEQVVVFD